MQSVIVLDEKAEREARVMHRYRAEVASYWAKWHCAVGLCVALGLVFATGLGIAVWNYLVIGLGETVAEWGDFSFLLAMRFFGWHLDPDYYKRIVEFPLEPLTLDHMPWSHLFGFVTVGTCLITAFISFLHFEPTISLAPHRYIRIEPVRLNPPIEVFFANDRGVDQKCVIEVMFTAPGPASANAIREMSRAISQRCQMELQALVDNAVWQIRLPQLRRHLLGLATQLVPRDVIHDLQIRSIRMRPAAAEHDLEAIEEQRSRAQMALEELERRTTRRAVAAEADPA